MATFLNTIKAQLCHEPIEWEILRPTFDFHSHRDRPHEFSAGPISDRAALSEEVKLQNFDCFLSNVREHEQRFWHSLIQLK
jgi:hypothetical protein